MLQFKLKLNNKKCFSGQRTHTIECNGEVAGQLYDNRECDEQRDDFAFFPYASRIAGDFLPSRENRDERGYLLHAEGIRGNDLAEVLDMIREWGEAVEAHVTEMRDDFRKVLDAIPDRPFEKTKSAGDTEGVLAKILKGSEGSFIMELTWAELAKMYGSGYKECQEYQVTDCGMRGQSYGIKWSHMRKSPTIQAVAYGGASLLHIERSAEHMEGTV